MKKISCVLGLFLFTLIAGTALEDFEQKTLQLRVGDLVTIPLEPLAGGDWEHRLITPSLMTILSNRRLETRIELVVKAQAEGTGRIETARIVSNRVVLRRYFFLKIAKREPLQLQTNQSAQTNEALPAQNGKESAEDRDFLQGVTLYEAGEYDEALHAFNLFIQRYPQSSRLSLARVYAGQAHFSGGEYERALADFTLAATSEDERIRLLSNMWTGNAAEALGRLDQAVAAFMNALNPQYPEIDIRARTGLAVSYGRRGKLKMATAQFDKLFKLYAATKESNAGYLPALYHAASFYDRNAGEAEIAVRYYREFIELTLRSRQMSMLIKRQLVEARTRLAWLEKHYIDYR